MSDPIKAALEAAVMQRCETINDRCHCRSAEAVDRVACADALQGMAEDCSAFLRELPADVLTINRHDAAVGYIWNSIEHGSEAAWWAKSLAAAVEEAARDG